VEVVLMERVLASDLGAHAGSRVAMAGWVHHQRHLAKVSFLLLRDRSGIAQVVVEGGATHDLESETVVEIEGLAVASDQAPGGVELHDPVVRVVSTPAAPTPFELRRPELNATLPTRLDHAALALRHPKAREAARISAASMAGFRATLDDLGFTEIQTPKVVGAATESGANVFGLDWFGRPAFLAQSPQLYKQVMVGVFERVYEVGPVFRAEPHDTVRHLAEYVSMDVELGFIDDHRDVERVLRAVLAGMVRAIEERVGPTDVHVPEEIPRIHFSDALRLVGAPDDEPDLAPAHERALGEWALAEHGSDFVFVEGYPMVKRPFYTHAQPDDHRWSNSFDLLFRGMELVTGGQRLHRYDDYLAVMDAPAQESLSGYLDAFKYGMPPHGGFAIGLERWVARVTGAANVREVTLFPRDINRLSP
jgi:nondiscriminating aspartyl-tRNA synthetase